MITTTRGAPKSQAMMAGMGLSFLVVCRDSLSGKADKAENGDNDDDGTYDIDDLVHGYFFRCTGPLCRRTTSTGGQGPRAIDLSAA
ncbi:hypothetical protein [Yoonia vestfoldensis]|uniref:hypothetical protein n=1 Tax=Yoonia vestfoldensis TaxID=245188 RepID=UPI000372D1A9|nr:hypothetical protein [Yoonia vestfoldensis]